MKSESPELWKAITMRRRTREALDTETTPGIPRVRYWNWRADVAYLKLEPSDAVNYLAWARAEEGEPAAMICLPE